MHFEYSLFSVYKILIFRYSSKVDSIKKTYMSQKIPFVLALTLVGSFAGFPGQLPTQNGSNLNAQQTNPNIESLGSILKIMFETYEDQKKEKMKQENLKFLDMKKIFSIKDLCIMATKDAFDLRVIHSLYEHKITLIEIILTSLFDLINEKYPQGKIKDSFEIFDKNSKEIKEKQYFELKNIHILKPENIDIENEQNSQFLIKNKENLVVDSSFVRLQLENLSHLLFDMIKIVQSKQDNPDNQLNCLEKKFKECNDLENEANLHKELAIEKLKKEKENEHLSNLDIISTHNKIFKEYLNKTIMAQNSICDLKFNALKETIMTLLSCLLSQQDILKIEEILSQN